MSGLAVDASQPKPPLTPLMFVSIPSLISVVFDRCPFGTSMGRTLNLTYSSIDTVMRKSGFCTTRLPAKRVPSCLSVWVPPRKIVSRNRTHPFLRLLQRSSSFVLSRRRHSRARLPVLSNQTRFQQEELSNNCWRTSTDTEKVSKRLHQADCPHDISTSLRG